MSCNIVVNVSDLSKDYLIYNDPLDRLKQCFFSGNSKYERQFNALKDISFSISQGESVGIIGKNGSGKSTLLHLLTNTLKASSGDIRIYGKVAALLELGTGFDLELTGIENIRLNAALHGVSKEKLNEKIKKIIDFSDIGDFIDKPIKTYSSGMVVRLAFSIIAHVDADILIIDEALAVGDVIFTQKCMRFIREFRKQGTLIFVSHDMALVQNLCDKAIWLDSGVLKKIGSSKEVSEDYLQYSLQQLISDDKLLHSIEENSRVKVDAIVATNVRSDFSKVSGWYTGDAELKEIVVDNLTNQNNAVFSGGETISIRITAVAIKKLEKPIIGFLLRDRLGQDLLAENTVCFTRNMPIEAQVGQVLTAEFHFQLPLLPNGQYVIGCSIADGEIDNNIQHHFVHDAIVINVSSNEYRWGVVGVRLDYINFSVE